MTLNDKLEDAVTGQYSVGTYARQKDCLQSIQSARDKQQQISEKWNHKRTLERHSLSENYTNGDISIVCNLNILVPDASVPGDMAMNQKPFGNLKVTACLVYRFNSGNGSVFDVGDKQFVLVHNVETVKLPNGVSLPSIVGLHGVFDEVDDIFGGVLFCSVSGVFKCLLGFPDRESSEFLSVEQSRVPCVIERGTHVMDSISQDKEKFCWQGLSWSDVNKIIASLHVILDGDFVRVVPSESFSPVFEVVDVMFGPL